MRRPTLDANYSDPKDACKLREMAPGALTHSQSFPVQLGRVLVFDDFREFAVEKISLVSFSVVTLIESVFLRSYEPLLMQQFFISKVRIRNS